jgi:putative spermidine/putrescine transport system permease protein
VPGRFTAALEQIFLSPLLLPAAVLGLGLLQVLSLSGWRGYFLGGLLAHVIVASPFVVRACLSGLRQLDPKIVEASQSLGAGSVRTFLRVVVPSITPSIASGAIFAFVISFDEAVVTLFLVGPNFETLPVNIFTYVQYSNDPSVAAISTIILVICAVLVGLLNKAQGGKHD